MDTAKWPQEFVVKPMNEIVTNTCLKQPLPLPPPPQTVGTVVGSVVERKTRPQKEQALNCPRCNSIHTKFCYYNNYSLTQPRYFCKDCRRYWTEGGSLRNIPIGGGSRKNKRSSSSSTTTSSSSSNSNSSPSKKQLFAPNSHQNPNINEGKVQVQDLGFSQGNNNAHEVKDLNLAFSQGFGIGQHHHNSIAEFLQIPSIKNNNNPLVSTSSALELLGISNSSGSSISRPSFMGFPHVNDPSSVYTPSASGFGLTYPPFQEFMRPPTLGFSLDGNGSVSGFGGEPLNQEEGSNSNINNSTTSNNTNGIPLLPFESLKLPVSSSSTNSSGGGGNDHQNHHQSHHQSHHQNHHQNHQEQQQEQGSSDHEEEKEEAGDQSAGFWSGMLGVGGGAAGATAASGGGTWQL